MHAKKQLRDAVVALLQADNIKWKHVYNTRISTNRDVLPYVSVWIDSESIEQLTVHPAPIYGRSIDFVVVCRSRIPTSKELFEDMLDEMQIEVENKLTTSDLNLSLDGKLKSLAFLSSSTTLVDDENERSFGEVQMIFRSVLITQEGDPETLI